MPHSGFLIGRKCSTSLETMVALVVLASSHGSSDRETLKAFAATLTASIFSIPPDEPSTPPAGSVLVVRLRRAATPPQTGQQPEIVAQAREAGFSVEIRAVDAVVSPYGGELYVPSGAQVKEAQLSPLGHVCAKAIDDTHWNVFWNGVTRRIQRRTPCPSYEAQGSGDPRERGFRWWLG